MDNERLLEAAKRGDRKAFESLVELYHDELYYTAAGIVRSGWEALDICQDTFIKAYTSLKSLKDVSKFRAWINRILINKCNDYFRRNRRLVIVEDLQVEGCLNEISEENIDLMRCLSALKSETREVLVLRYFQDLSIKEIASIIGCPEGTVKSRINRGLKELRCSIDNGSATEVK